MMNRAYLVETVVQTESVEMDEGLKADSHCQPADIALTFSSSGSQSNESKILPRHATKHNVCHGMKPAWKLGIFIVILSGFVILLAASGLSALFAVSTMRETVAIVADWANTSSSTMIHATTPAMPAAPELRLVGGSDATRGRLEVLYKGLWGLVCNVGFDEADATVACRQLGYGSGTVLWWRRWYEGVTVPKTNLSTPMWLSAVSCNGSEQYLYQCPHSGWNITSGCSLADDIVVKCQSLTTLFRALSAIRTTTTSTATTRGTSTRGMTTRGLTTPAATGQSLRTTADHVASAATVNMTIQPWALRLSHLERKRGVLEIFHNGFWGAVCITGFNEDYDATAELACRNLNFSTGYSLSDDGQQVSLYALQDLLCGGNEVSLAECNRCSTASDCEGGPLVVQCMDRLEDRMTGIRLLEGHDNSSGYVQLHVNGSWGFLCSNWQFSSSGSWDMRNAQVLCRQLGMIRSHPRLLSSRKRTL